MNPVRVFHLPLGGQKMLSNAAIAGRLRQFVATDITLFVSGVVGAGAIVLMVAFLLKNSYEVATSSAERSAFNLIQLIDADIARNLELYDLTMTGVIEAARSRVGDQMSPQARHALMFSRVATTHFMGGTLLLDAHGAIREDWASLVPRHSNFADRDYFKVHQNNPDVGFYISRPLRSRLDNKDWRLVFSRRMPTQDGRFDGIVASALRLAYFDDLFRSLQLDRESTITILSGDGIVLARRGAPGEADLTGIDVRHRRNFEQIVRMGSGSFTSRSQVDGVTRRYVFSRIGHHPLIIVVALSLSEAYGAWASSAIIIGMATAFLCLGILAVTLLLRRELHRQRATGRRLASLAATDALTGLPNRRHLEVELQGAVEQSRLTGQPLSVLMLDVDHFKSFNDRYGHLVGDEVLRQVAEVIRRSVHRPGDVAARYGGEEFAVVLPQTEYAGAQRIAETIRAAVAALPPVGADMDTVTLSVGAISRVVADTDNADVILIQADTALYAAKRSGRNCVVSFGQN
ncbi:GGDEF domain-containing protein [Paludibacterium yongneupense]|uniref:GGDEF domain-containing protein n=1 Tax=Paludibacterium yongneupense TaxID=400061 RepID=UPI0004090720|nr:sensor domain-containing diguanylate cyclase [Paludibacterium yongneupense]